MIKRKLLRAVFRRRREGKTDYKAREQLLKAREPRIVIRKTNRYIIAHIVKSKAAQDFSICYVNSKELETFGWKFGFKNIPAAYLTGKLLAKKALEKGIKKVVADIGLNRSTKGSRIYAVIKGAHDGGLEINCDEGKFPTEERIKGTHTKESSALHKIFEEINEKLER